MVARALDVGEPAKLAQFCKCTIKSILQGKRLGSTHTIYVKLYAKDAMP